MSGTRTTPLTRADIVGKAIAIADTDSGLPRSPCAPSPHAPLRRRPCRLSPRRQQGRHSRRLVDAVFAEIYTPCIR